MTPKRRSLRAIALVGGWLLAMGWQLSDAVPSTWTALAASLKTPVRVAATMAPASPPAPAPPPRRSPEKRTRQPAPVTVKADRLVSRSEAVAAGSEVPHPPPIPAGLPERFDESRVFDAVITGLDEVGFAGEVELVDCSEFPCLFVGRGFGTSDEASLLRQTEALRDYVEDTTAVYGWTEPGEDGGLIQRFAVALYPHAQTQEDETFQRLGARLQVERASSR